MKKKWIVPAIVLVALLALSPVLYKNLSQQVRPETAPPAATAEAVPAVTPETAVTEAPAEPESEDPLAPDFSVYNGEGESVYFSDFAGRPAVINFWASWCPPCRSELPAFESAWETYGDRVEFLMVDLTDGSRETVEIAQSFIAEEGYAFPVYFDSDYSGASAYGIYSIPMTVFVDASGRIRGGRIGAMAEETLTAGLEELLNG